MHKSGRVSAFLAAAVLVALILPAAAQAKTIYVNSGVSGAKIGMSVSKAVKKLGKVRRIEKDTYYGPTYWRRSFGKKSNGHYAVAMESDGKNKVVGFFIWSRSYLTKKRIHVGSSATTLKKSYGKSLHKTADGYMLKGKSATTTFEVTKSKISLIWMSGVV